MVTRAMSSALTPARPTVVCSPHTASVVLVTNTLPGTGVSESVMIDLNDQTTFNGGSYTGTTAWIDDGTGPMQLGLNVSGTSTVTAINEAGQVIGYTGFQSNARGWFYDPATGTTTEIFADFPSSPGTGSFFANFYTSSTINLPVLLTEDRPRPGRRSESLVHHSASATR